jgi:hypothetical protein
MQAMRLVAGLLLLVPCCRQGDVTQRTGSASTAGDQHIGHMNPYHYSEADVYATAGRALGPLLEFRATTELTDFDASIRELSKVVCAGAQPDVLRLVESEPIHKLWPLGSISNCHKLRCGGCRSVSGSYLLGSAFKELPALTPRTSTDE